MLYRGVVAEAGDVEAVIKRPRHPYTQLLISSIPLVSTERTWTSDGVASSPAPRAWPGRGARLSTAARP